ncbi:MAG: glycoside hydrolase family 92 protein, partial [Chlorobi bacterium]|nr:glycoside hydrolase family 92 protein [Chlorobiota bacterium]
MKRIILLLLIPAFFISCNTKQKPKQPVDYINPFIGTGGHGHTYPGAVVPFGMVQLSPDTRKDSWDGCSGYHYSDSVVFGFSHTHLSGTGVGDYGDIRFMPTLGPLKTNPGTAETPDSGYASRFSHEKELAKAGYYGVYLQDYDIYVGLTTTERVGFHKYMFATEGEGHIIIDLKESVTSEKILDSRIAFISDHEIAGLRRTDGWADDQYVYFYADFSKPFKSFGIVENDIEKPGDTTASGTNLKAWVDFDVDEKEIIYVKVGISAVDVEGAKSNLYTEIPGWDFDEMVFAARKRWTDQIKKIQVGGGTDAQKEVFYTALYHTMLAPNIYSDADARYRGHDHKIHRDTTFTMYTVFSLWDTFRTLHPLFTIIERKRTVDLIKSMLDMYKYDGLLPVWELAGNETNCMIGYHAVPVIVDAYTKGIRNFDAELALEAMLASAGSNLFGLDWLRKKGYIPADKEGESVSKTLEYAYDDWCIARMAGMLDKRDVEKEFLQRAQYYKNLLDKETGFFRGRSNGSFVEPFDPTEVNFMLTEANTWQYNFFVPQDISTHIGLLGGDEKYEARLDQLFHSESKLSGRDQSDITGLIGQYAHGNEPSHNMAYLYNYVGSPWKTQELVNRITSELYTNNPDGLSGNEDCGQMSAWYVMSAMGFYPVTPGSDIYVLGTPVFESMKLNLENGNDFEIRAKNLSEENFYIQSVSYNGQPWTKSYITHQMIMDGGVLEFEMGSQPNPGFGKAKENRPIRKITKYPITPVPYFKAISKTFENLMIVGIADLYDDAQIRWGYQTEEDEPALKKYIRPIEVTRSTKFTAVASRYGKNSFFENAEYLKIPAGRTVKVKYPYSS